MLASYDAVLIAALVTGAPGAIGGKVCAMSTPGRNDCALADVWK